MGFQRATLVIEDEDSRALRPEMLFSAYLQLDAGERGAQLAPGGHAHVDGVTIRLVEHGDGKPE